MTTLQRTKNDTATNDRREMEDRTVRDNRARNDEMTAEKRLKADLAMGEKRARNDEMTVDRRERNDRNPARDFALVMLVLVLLAFGLYVLLRY